MPHRHRLPAGNAAPEVIVKIDRGDGSSSGTPSTPQNADAGVNNVQRETSLEFWRDNAAASSSPATNNPDSELNDPPSKLIGQFLTKQKAAGGEMSLDLDLEMDELRSDPNNQYNRSKDLNDSQPKNPHTDSSSGDDDSQQNLNHRRSNNIISNTDINGGAGNNNDGAVTRCTSIQRRYNSGLGRIKTQSRLMDPPEIIEKQSDTLKSSQGHASGHLRPPATGGGDEDDDDPLFNDDLPDEYTKAKYDTLTIVQFISLVLLISVFACTLSISELKMAKFRGLTLWEWEVLVLVLICGRLVSGWVIRIIVFFIERNFFMRKRILYFVYGVRKAVQNCIWLGLLLIAWHSVFDKELEVNNEFLWYVNRLMVCLVVGTSLWLVKTLMVKVLASSFHVSTFFDRIQESLFNQYIIETLSGPPLIEIRNQQEEEDRTLAEIWSLQNGGAVLPPELRATDLKKKIGTVASSIGLPKSAKVSFRFSEQVPKNQEDPGIPIEKLHKLNHKNISAWNMKRLIKIVRQGFLTTLDERVLGNSGNDENSTKIRSEHEASSAARKIFKNVAKSKAKYIYAEDLMRFLQEEEAMKVLNLVEGSTESERISKASLKSWVVNSFVERRALALTLNDTKTAVDKLHQMVNVIIGIIIFIICLIILHIASGKFLLYISSQIVVVAFIFGNTLKTIFEAVIFVFVMHPFDVGDRCEVDGIQMVVEEMNILTTVFLRYDNQKILYPNVTLATRPISNFYRSPDMGDAIEFTVHIATPPDRLALIKQRITSYIESRNDYWYPAPTIVLMDLVSLDAIKLSVWLRHHMNHQNIGEKWRRRALLVEEMIKIFKELDIEYRIYPVDINIRSMSTAAAPSIVNSSRMPSSWNLPPTPPPPSGS